VNAPFHVQDVQVEGGENYFTPMLKLLIHMVNKIPHHHNIHSCKIVWVTIMFQSSKC
jgi:hypothetical protein